MLDFLRLNESNVIGIDTETKDPFLKTEGPGWGRGVGDLLGISLATPYGACYIDVETLRVFYYEKEKLVSWHEPEVFKLLSDMLASSKMKVGANLQYDLGWLADQGLWTEGPYYDVLSAEKLIDPFAFPTLDSIARHYLGTAKKKSAIDDYNKKHFPGSKDARENLWKMPTELVAEYAIEDSVLPLKIMPIIDRKISALGLNQVLDVENRLLPLLVKMRQRGMRYDIDRVDEAEEHLSQVRTTCRMLIRDIAGDNFNPGSSPQIAKRLEQDGITLPRTKKGNPSAAKDVLEKIDHPLVKIILEWRNVDKMIGTFIHGIRDHGIHSKVYPLLKPLTPITGRFSCEHPNGQQIPSRDDTMAPLIRGIFVPDTSEHSWLKLDYSQIEYRMLAHCAKEAMPHDPDVQALVKAFQNRKTDYHDLVRAMVEDITGLDLPRGPVKNINFGLVYGMTINKLTKLIASSLPEDQNPDEFSQTIINSYLAGFPVPKKFMDYCINDVQRTEETRTILNRRVPFTRFEHRQARGLGTLPKREAISKYGRFAQVAGAYKAPNYRLQGSAADYIKLAMVQAYESGIFEKTGYPYIQVHDELDFSFHPDLANHFRDLVSSMEHAYELHIPMVMGADMGPDWGHLREVTL